MKTLTLAVALTGTLLSAAVVQAQTLTSENEKLSYGLGLILGENLLQDFDQLDVDAFRRGVETVYSKVSP
ncbi:FKBP-type peptidyl-prolyl cis-trans isomerase N-terminal domain-containing protein [Nitrincola nitratireducens]|uniref:Domain amino terminal to FKBP-type peptidyl-prolyl isomerase n=1 Tax=Nitrincola nitratireducens TaxID=1229521 RepID=W9V0K4_9GAMM|nr:FKBP-type peptidyl-prolyl cis-trans isomerase N-terminal domain-containing protein [Nitrincola nitratireducens]EXJ10491.1 Domain amino terminal to FKBP-type peptidyl-prolyl isomerase [Nitrincola nitratireducens]